MPHKRSGDASGSESFVPLLQVPTCRLLSIWAELVEAYHGVNGYGGNVAEIYSFVLQPSSPAAMHLDEAKSRVEKLAAQAVASICGAFEREYMCRIRIDDKRPAAWARAAKFDHRCHIKVYR